MNEFFSSKLNDSGGGEYVYYFIYAMSIFFAELMFLLVVQDLFTDYTGFARASVQIGAVTAGLSAIVYPYARMNWIAKGRMTTVADIFWALDAAILILNMLLAFDLTTNVSDSYVLWWKHFSPFSPGFPIIMWGTLFKMHPKSQARQEITSLQYEIQQIYVQKLKDAVNSDQTSVVIANATALAVDRNVKRDLNISPNNLISGISNNSPTLKMPENAELFVEMPENAELSPEIQKNKNNLLELVNKMPEKKKRGRPPRAEIKDGKYVSYRSGSGNARKYLGSGNISELSEKRKKKYEFNSGKLVK